MNIPQGSNVLVGLNVVLGGCKEITDSYYTFEIGFFSMPFGASFLAYSHISDLQKEEKAIEFLTPDDLKNKVGIVVLERGILRKKPPVTEASI